jgi:glycerol-3-phosphate dehydrogenase
MAEDAINAVQKLLTGRVTDSRTRNYPLWGVQDDSESVEELSAIYRLPRSTLRHLTEKFGGRRAFILDLIAENASLALPIIDGSPHIHAEVVYSVREESALCIEDILSRRLGLQFYDWRLAANAAPVIGEILAKELGWSAAQTKAEVDRYVDRINRCLEALGQEGVRVMSMHKENINDELHRRA